MATKKNNPAGVPFRAAAFSAARFVAPKGKTEERVFIDLSKKSKKANIVREGFGVPETKVNPTEVERVIGGLKIQRPKESPRVVGQSVKPGQRVAAGTSVDLILAPAGDIPISIFEGAHADLRERSIALFLEQTLDKEDNRNALKIVLSKETADDLSDSEKAVIESMLENADVGIDETDNERDLPSAYRVLRYTSAYR